MRKYNIWGETAEEYIKRKTKRIGSCLIWQSKMNNRPGWFSFPGSRENSAPRAVFMIRKGRIPKGKLILHSCDNPKCVEMKHLRIGTSKDNRKDFLERNPNAKILIAKWKNAGAKGSQRHWDSMSK